MAIQNVKIFHKVNEKWLQKSARAVLYLIRDKRNIYKIVSMDQETLINLPVSDVDIKPYNESAVQWKITEGSYVIHYGVRFSSTEEKNLFVARYNHIKNLISPARVTSPYTEYMPKHTPEIDQAILTNENEEDTKNINQIISKVPLMLKKAINFTASDNDLERSLRSQMQRDPPLKNK